MPGKRECIQQFSMLCNGIDYQFYLIPKKYTNVFSALVLAKTALLYIINLTHIAAGVCAVANIKVAF